LDSEPCDTLSTPLIQARSSYCLCRFLLSSRPKRHDTRWVAFDKGHLRATCRPSTIHSVMLAFLCHGTPGSTARRTDAHSGTSHGAIQQFLPSDEWLYFRARGECHACDLSRRGRWNSVMAGGGDRDG